MKNKYKHHFQNPKFEKIFLKFKEYILDEELNSAKRCAKIISSNLNPLQIDILELGAGDGKVSLSFLEELQKTHNINRYFSLDIGDDLVNLMEEKRKLFEKFAKSVSFRCVDVEKYKSNKRFDIVLAINSFYGINFNVIRKLQKNLKTNGIFAILLNTKDSLTLDLTRQFIEPIISAEDLINWLEKEGFSFRSYDIMAERLSRKNFISENKINPSAEFVYRYLLRKINEPIEDIFPYLKEKPDIYFQIPQKLILITK